MGRAVVITIMMVIALHASPAHADAVDQLIAQLDDSSDKVRLSAALNLAKLGDPRAILSLAKRVNVDTERDKNVRGAAAVGLGKLVNDSKVKPNIKKLAVSALKRAAASDPSDFVKEQADKALAALDVGGSGGSGGSTTPPLTGGSIYVNIGPMSSKTGTDDAKFREMMVKIASKTMGKTASTMQTSWPGGGAPTKAALAQKGFQGFYIDGTLNELKIEKSGSTSTVSCKISMLLASYPDKSVFGFLSGGAKVQASASASDVALAREDCVAAVVEDLIAKKIVPTIKSKVGP